MSRWNWSPFLAWLLLAVSLNACQLFSRPTSLATTKAEVTVSFSPSNPVITPTRTLTRTPRQVASSTLTVTATLRPSETVTDTPGVTATQEPSETPLPSLTPTYAILRGRVLELSNCRYGPGAPYLYKYALIEGSNLEVIGRNEQGTWILVQAIGGNNPCWVKANLMAIKGDVMAVQPTYIPLPRSPYYGPPTGVSASRDGNVVTVSWYGIQLRPGDDSEQTPYIVEAWVCVGGQIVFTPVGSYANAVQITDEPGCSEPSHGRLTAAEKHGYTRWVEIPWPQAS